MKNQIKKNNLLEFKTHFTEELIKIYPKREIGSFFNLLCEFHFNWSKVEVALNMQYILTAVDIKFFTAALSRLKKQEPLQYILGETEFYGLKFKVNEHVLIPRQETEELVQWILSENDKKRKLNVLDIGTGSACIPIALKKNAPHWEITAADVSEQVLQQAKKNAQLNKVAINFTLKDILSEDLGSKTWDIIVSNPPYITKSEVTKMNKNVLNYEPHLALFVEDNNPLLFYRRIIELVIKNKSIGGKIFFEINEAKQTELEQLLATFGLSNYAFKNDINGRCRMLGIWL